MLSRLCVTNILWLALFLPLPSNSDDVNDVFIPRLLAQGGVNDQVLESGNRKRGGVSCSLTFCWRKIVVQWPVTERRKENQLKNMKDDKKQFLRKMMRHLIVSFVLYHHPPPHVPTVPTLLKFCAWICGDSSNSNTSRGNHLCPQASHYRSRVWDCGDKTLSLASRPARDLLSSPFLSCPLSTVCKRIICNILKYL